MLPKFVLYYITGVNKFPGKVLTLRMYVTDVHVTSITVTFKYNKVLYIKDCMYVLPYHKIFDLYILYRNKTCMERCTVNRHTWSQWVYNVFRKYLRTW